MRHRDALVPLLAERLRLRPRADWLAALEAAKVPCGPINDLAEVFADPQVRERGMTVTVPHPHTDALRTGGQPDEAVGHAGAAAPRRRRCWASTPTRCWPRSASTQATRQGLRERRVI